MWLLCNKLFKYYSFLFCNFQSFLNGVLKAELETGFKSIINNVLQSCVPDVYVAETN